MFKSILRLGQYIFALPSPAGFSDPNNVAISSNTLPLFGVDRAFVPPAWETKDDRVRGGASRSYLDPLLSNTAVFYGNLDTSTLGGAGFASQFSNIGAAPLHPSSRIEGDDRYWDLSRYDGIKICFLEAKRANQADHAVPEEYNKTFTFIVRDEPERGLRQRDGRNQAGISWEVEFNPHHTKSASGNGTRTVWLPWTDFKATYRGKEIKDPEPLRTNSIRRVAIMMRSHFGKQDGDFRLTMISISASKKPRESEGVQ